MTSQPQRMPTTLIEALAAFQADPPTVEKKKDAGKSDGKSKNTGKDFGYKYADLADINAQVLPRLGAVGLAFTSRPTLLDGELVLVYALVHVSGEREEGIYPLGRPGSLGPQQLGGLITYAKRYCLCAITGIAPEGDDDDAQGAEQAHRQQSAGDIFDTAAPAQPRQVAREQATPPPEPVTDDEWLDSINDSINHITDRESGTRVYTQIVAGHNAGKCTAEDRKALLGMVTSRVAGVLKPQAEEPPE